VRSTAPSIRTAQADVHAHLAVEHVDDPPDLDALVAALGEHGVVVVGPPPVPTAA
jgi:hypothetical protein